jgi:hypothetical protein
MWILGFIAGLAAVVVVNFMLVLGVAIVVIVSLIRPRPAAAAGVCVAWGAGFLVVMWQAAERCAALNRQPHSSCTTGDNTPFAVAGIAVLAVGIALTAFAAWQARPAAIPSSS